MGGASWALMADVVARTAFSRVEVMSAIVCGLQWLVERDITPYMPTRDSIHRKNNSFYGPERFTYLPESSSYRCPAGQPLNDGGRNMSNRTYAYIRARKRCGACSQKAQCTARHVLETQRIKCKR